MADSNDTQHSGFQLNPSLKQVCQIREWSRFLGVLGLIVSAFLVIVSVFGGSILSNLEQTSARGSNKSTLFVIGLLLIAFIISALSITLMMFSKSIDLKSDQHIFSGNASRYLARYFRLAGIFTILLFVLVALQASCGIF